MKCSHISLNLYAGLFKESNMLVNPPQANSMINEMLLTILYESKILSTKTQEKKKAGVK